MSEGVNFSRPTGALSVGPLVDAIEWRATSYRDSLKRRLFHHHVEGLQHTHRCEVARRIEEERAQRDRPEAAASRSVGIFSKRNECQFTVASRSTPVIQTTNGRQKGTTVRFLCLCVNGNKPGKFSIHSSKFRAKPHLIRFIAGQRLLPRKRRLPAFLGAALRTWLTTRHPCIQKWPLNLQQNWS
jgi:hypothetical protein